MEGSALAAKLWQACFIAKANLRHNFWPHLILSVLALSLTPVLFGLSGLDHQASAVPLEMYVSLLGIILLTPIYQPELDSRVREVVSAKYASRSFVCLIRVVYSGIALLLLVSLMMAYMKLNNCQVSLELWFGTVSTAAFLGSLGMLAAAVTRSIAVSYMVPVGYYAMNLAGGLKLGDLGLFSMLSGQYEQKVWLLAASVAMMAGSMAIDRYFR